MLGAASATARPRLRSMLCLAKTAACAELPRAHVTTNCGGFFLSRATNSTIGAASKSFCRRTISGASLISAVMRASCADIALCLGRHCCFLARESERAGDSIGERRREILSHAWREIGFDLLRESADERESERAEIEQTDGQRIDVAGRESHQRRRKGVGAGGVVEHERRKFPEVARASGGHPMHDLVRVRLEFSKQLGQELRRRNALIVRPQHAAKRFAAEPGAAALVRDRKAPTAAAMRFESN